MDYPLQDSFSCRKNQGEGFRYKREFRQSCLPDRFVGAGERPAAAERNCREYFRDEGARGIAACRCFASERIFTPFQRPQPRHKWYKKNSEGKKEAYNRCRT